MGSENFFVRYLFLTATRLQEISCNVSAIFDARYRGDFFQFVGLTRNLPESLYERVKLVILLRMKTLI